VTRPCCLLSQVVAPGGDSLRGADYDARMKKIIDAEFEVVDGPPPRKSSLDWRWIFWGVRIGLGLIALLAVIASSLKL